MNSSPESPINLVGRITLRRVILFVYIIISTIVGSMMDDGGGGRGGYPVVKHKEPDSYYDPPNLLSNAAYQAGKPVREQA